MRMGLRDQISFRNQSIVVQNPFYRLPRYRSSELVQRSLRGQTVQRTIEEMVQRTLKKL